MYRPETISRLCNFVLEIVKEEAADDSDITDIFDRRKKTQKIAQVREKILRRLRGEIRERYTGTPRWEVERVSKVSGSSWKPLGYLQIATAMGGNHTAWVKMMGEGPAAKNRKREIVLCSDQKLIQFSCSAIRE